MKGGVDYDVRASLPVCFVFIFLDGGAPSRVLVPLGVFCFLSIPNSSARLSAVAHEYVKIDGNKGTIGVTDFAQAALGDIVFVDLPSEGDEFEKGESFGSVESVKAASDVYAPVGGKVIEVNSVLEDEPGTINTDPEGDGWFIKIEIADEAEAEELMNEDDYKKHCDDSKS